ncbi:MAG: ribonuclease M5 [Clostridia bacterium]|nr:ribonuclease M5 [Clostridia bacterium]
MNIKEVIVVEGRDDETAVKQAVSAEIIITHGFGIREKTFKQIEEASKRCGVIIFTDPDYAGEQIRQRIAKRIKGCKHAFLPREEALKGDDIGIENATPDSIIAALSKVHTVVDVKRSEFSMADLVKDDLSGSSEALRRRDALGKLLGIGYGNGKQLVNRLNHYGITREAYYEALSMLEKESD